MLSRGMLGSNLIGSNVEGELKVTCADDDDNDKEEEGEENCHHHHHHHQRGICGQKIKSPSLVASDGSTQCKE